MIKTHEVKIYPEYFNAVDDGTKLAELRKDDRCYKVGDILKMCEYIDRDAIGIASMGKYTGRVLIVLITHKHVGLGLQPDFCSLSIKKLLSTTTDVLNKSLSIVAEMLTSFLAVCNDKGGNNE